MELVQSSEVLIRVKNFQDYCVNDLGQVISFKHGKRRELKLQEDHGGYLTVWLYAGHGGKGCKVHQLVAEAFHGSCPEGMEVLHGPGGRKDNSPKNLRYGTRVENQRDRIRDGTNIYSRGEQHYKTSFTTGQILEIRRRNAAGERVIDLAREFNVGRLCIRGIVLRLTWKHIQEGI